MLTTTEKRELQAMYGTSETIIDLSDADRQLLAAYAAAHGLSTVELYRSLVLPILTNFVGRLGK